MPILLAEQLSFQLIFQRFELLGDSKLRMVSRSAASVNLPQSTTAAK